MEMTSKPQSKLSSPQKSEELTKEITKEIEKAKDDRLKFTVNKRLIVREAEVVYSKSIGSAGSGFSKVGIQFKALKPEDSKEIASFVLAENRKFVSKLIG